MWKKLPDTQPQAGLTIGSIYRSLFVIAKQNPHLIRRACAGALGFGILSMVFTSMTFVLGSTPYHFTDFEIGLFGLLGIIGIYSSSWSGKTVGQGRENLVAKLCIALMLSSTLPLYFAQQNIVIYAIGVLMAYFGLSAFHVLNQNLVYRIDLKSRSRINAVYMTIYFSGAALGSLGTVYAWEHFEWIGCVVLGFIFSIGILLIDRWDFRKRLETKISS
jgi:predicted MFS family arabinose efflux permease